MANLDHIGIAVSPDSKLAKLLQLLELPISGSESVASESVDVDWIDLPDPNPRLELLRPSSPDSVIANFLTKMGKDGIHHLCFRVQDIATASQKIQSEGFKMIYPEAKQGAADCLVNFVHPKSTGGLLVELSQKSAK